ncbi:MAG: hypothetical protein NXI27_11145 [Alphaproteobacteria bacterium]|nr:hypothetical protein [Alphaproteobacteria bacterium]
MKNLIVHSAMAAMVMTAPFLVADASAKVKSVKHHFVQSQFEDYPVMELKYQSGRWNWTNSSKTFMPRVKLYFKSSTKVDEAKLYVDKGKFGLWTLPVGYKTKKYEKLITVRIGKTVLGKHLGLAQSVCKSSGGPKKVVKDVAVNTTFYATDVSGAATSYDTKASRKPMLMKVVCHSKVPNGNAASSGHSSFKFKVTKTRLYTIPSRPVCGKPVKLVAEIHANRPGKANFTLFRGDGEKQNASVTIGKSGKGFAKRWAKTYKLNKTTSRKYMIVVNGHKQSTNWVPLKVRCNVAKGLSG